MGSTYLIIFTSKALVQFGFGDVYRGLANEEII
jgi:hypothetical protein